MFKKDTVLSWFSVKWSTKAHQQENFISVKFDGYGMDINSGNDKVTATNKLAFMKPFHSPGGQDCLPGVLYSSSLMMIALARKAISPLVILFAPLLLIGALPVLSACPSLVQLVTPRDIQWAGLPRLQDMSTSIYFICI